MPFLLDQAVDLFNPAIQKIFLKASTLDDRNFEKYVNVSTGITDYNFIDSSLSGLGEASFMPENGVIVEQQPVQGYDRAYTQEAYSNLIAFSQQQWMFGIKKRKLEGVAQELFLSCVRKREKNFAERLINFTATSYTQTNASGSRTVTISGGDTVAFGSASHTREDGGTNWNNIVTDGTTVNMDWEYDGLRAAYRTAGLVPDPQGNPTDFSPGLFIFRRGSPSAFRALEILGAIKKGSLPGGNDNDGSGVGAYKILELPYLTTAANAYWFGLDERFKNDRYGFQYLESLPISLDPANKVYKTKEIQYSAQNIYAAGHNDPRPWVCSTGANV